MRGEVVQLGDHRPALAADARRRLRRMGSLLAAIEDGDLLAALPECAMARADHVVALDLLSLLRDELDALTLAIEGYQPQGEDA